jgi:signal transduction histidine kinase
MDLERFESMKRYVGFDEAAAIRLRLFHPLAEPSFVEVVDDFYETIRQHPDASAAVTGGPPQVERLKRTLVQWLHSLLLGPHDEAYLAAHSRIGKVHVRINLPQQFMFTAMNRMRGGLVQIATEQIDGDSERASTVLAVHQMLDLELAIMLDTYREHWMDRVRVNERLATIGQLAASIGHELRNPLGIVQSSLFLIDQRKQKLGLTDDVLEKHHQRINAQVDACGRTISSLLDLARETPPRRTHLRALDLAESAIAGMNIPSEVAVRLTIPDDLTLFVDGSQLRQVLLNLFGNAVQALSQGGTIALSAKRIVGGVEFILADDGPGISDDVADRVFEVLFTTRATGTGLGLALCRKIVRAHHGELELLRTQGGASFRIWLPDEGDLGAH